MALLGGTDGLWAAALRARVASSPRSFCKPMERLSGPARGERGRTDADLQRRALVEVLMHEDRLRSLRRSTSRRSACARPAGYFAARAIAEEALEA